MKKEEVLRKIETLDKLPTLPEIAVEIIETVKKEDYSVRDLKRIIEKDPTLTAKILKVANTFAFNPYGREVTTIERAILQLGSRNLVPVVLGLTVAKIFVPKEKEFDAKLFWKHSYTCAHIAKRLARHFSLPESEAFTAGLLHDIGKIVLYIVSPENYLKAISLTESNFSLLEAELKVFGVDHTLSGEFLLKKWGIPEIIRYPVKFHHAPEKAEKFKELSALVNLSNILARTSGQYFGKDTFGLSLEEIPGWRILKEKIDDVDLLILPIWDDVEEAVEFCNIAWS